ncbi:MAG: glycosyltransferase family 9 protein [Candidatus Firestonebacteria bacterium]|nr:glycosyltransferase family 9 protein [Candidatus Firestonebacteria bacterium]
MFGKKETKPVKFLIFFLADLIAIRKPDKIVPKTLLLVRMDTIGDYVLFRNFIEILKKSVQYKDYQITLCGNIIWKDIALAFDKEFINDFIWINTDKFDENIFYRFKILRNISQKGFEIAIQPSFTRLFSYGDSIIKASYANIKIGSIGDPKSIKKWKKNISDKYYTKLIDATHEILFEFDRNKEFFNFLLNKNIFIKKPDIKIDNINSDIIPNESFVIISPGAGKAFRQWHVSNFIEISNFISNKYNLKIVVIGSSKDKKLALIIKQKVNHSNIIDLTEKTSLIELAKLISRAKLLISNDTGAAHIALAVDTSAIIISCGHHFKRFTQCPEEISNKMQYIYPEEIMDKINEINYYNVESNIPIIDINKIKVNNVIPLIKNVLGN